MDKNTEYKIALILYTSGLDYDDRVRKEILTIQKLYPNVKFKIFAVEPTNREEEGLTSYGVPYRIPYLSSRDKYSSSSHTLAKAMDLYKTLKKDIQDFDAVWCADEQPFPFIIFTKGKPIIWDLHELPQRFLNRFYMKWLFKMMERRCKVMLHANQPRLGYMNELGLISDVEKHYVLRNYPDFNEIDVEYDESYHRFEKWLGNDKCVYLQGISGIERADIESIGAVLEVSGLKAVVVGNIGSSRKAIIEQQFGQNTLAERVYFTGMIKQLKTPQYIRKCILSLIFYKNKNKNNWFCEPNRLFQNINNGNPVVVGNNPPMKELVEQYGVGVCADTDGCDQKKIVEAMNQLLDNIETYKANIAANEGKWLWATQEDTISAFVEKLL